MKKIEAIVRSEKVFEIRSALEKINYAGLTITQVDGHGNQRGTVQKWKGIEHKMTIIPKTKIEIIAKDNDAKAIVETILAAARTGAIGDGKIFVSTIDEAIKIRTGQYGESAL